MLKIFFEASQHKVGSVCVLIIFDIVVRCMEVDLLAGTSIGNKSGVRCPLFGVVRLEVSIISQQKTHNLFRVDENSLEQCCAAHIVQCCQQYCSALLSLN